VKRSGRPGRWVTASSGEGEAVDKQPGQRQRQSQQHPAPQPCREKHPHAPRPFRLSGPQATACRRQFFCPSFSMRSAPGRSEAMRRRAAGACLPALPAVWRHNHYGGVWRPWRNLNRRVGLRRFHGALTPDWSAAGVGTRAIEGVTLSEKRRSGRTRAGPPICVHPGAEARRSCRMRTGVLCVAAGPGFGHVLL
jgi:hypothetical protein